MKKLLTIIALVTIITACNEKSSDSPTSKVAETPLSYAVIQQRDQYPFKEGGSATVYDIGPITEKIEALKNKSDVFILGNQYYFCIRKPLTEHKTGLTKDELRKVVQELEPYAKIDF